MTSFPKLFQYMFETMVRTHLFRQKLIVVILEKLPYVVPNMKWEIEDMARTFNKYAFVSKRLGDPIASLCR